MEFRLANLVNDSIVDGPGFRLAVFVQGCPHVCKGCHNPATHDPSAGKPCDTATILRLAKANPLLSGITLTGGEPFAQCAPMAVLAQGAKALRLHVMAYSGYTFDQLVLRPDALDVLAFTDVLVDGAFQLNQRSLELAFRGSCNQRIIDIPTTLRTGQITLLNWDTQVE